MRRSKKVREALKRRLASFVPQSPAGHQQHRPGSQNIKKGCSAGTRTSRR